MQKRLQGLVAGVLIGATLFSGGAFAKQVVESAQIHFKNIKVYIDGAEIVPKGSNGEVVEPFIYNGATYLPVRAISNALGQDVDWDGATQSVYIGKCDQTKPDNYLDRIQYNDYKECYDDSSINIIKGKITDYNSKEYTNGLMVYIARAWNIEDDSDEANSIVGYPLNGQYSRLKGNIVIPKKYDLAIGKNDNLGQELKAVDVLFYGDGALLYKATEVSPSMPFSIDIDVYGVNQLTIKVKAKERGTYLALTDLALYK